jgi:hypothetical protein
MGFPLHSTGCVKRPQECWNESHTINGSAPAATSKEKPTLVFNFGQPETSVDVTELIDVQRRSVSHNHHASGHSTPGRLGRLWTLEIDLLLFKKPRRY